MKEMNRMSCNRRVLHLARNSKKFRTRKKNKHRLQNVFKIRLNRHNCDFGEGFGGYVGELVFHEYEQPYDRYIRQCKEEGLI